MDCFDLGLVYVGVLFYFLGRRFFPLHFFAHSWTKVGSRVGGSEGYDGGSMNGFFMGSV